MWLRHLAIRRRTERCRGDLGARILRDGSEGVRGACTERRADQRSESPNVQGVDRDLGEPDGEASETIRYQFHNLSASSPFFTASNPMVTTCALSSAH